MVRTNIVYIISVGLVIAMVLTGYNFALVQTTSAQMSSVTNMAANSSSGMMGENITGSINLMSIFSKAIGAEVKVTLSQATTSAESSIGNGTHALVAHIGQENGFLVYCVVVIDPDMKFHKVIIDPADGNILLSRELSEMESMMLHHGMMHQDLMAKGNRSMV